MFLRHIIQSASCASLACGYENTDLTNNLTEYSLQYPALKVYVFRFDDDDRLELICF
jgi:hypothetical protein